MQLKDIKTIKILGEYFKLTFTDNPIVSAKQTVLFGKTDFDNGEITIQDLPHKEVTILHELLECFSWVGKLKLNHEDLIRLSFILLAVIKDNPELFELIIKGGDNADVKEGEKDAS